jgi:4-hydroxybenzoate polyprenyltransferase
VLYGLGLALIVSGGLYLAAWVAYLIFLCWVVARHGPQALRDVAVAARAFPGTGFAVGIARALGRK